MVEGKQVKLVITNHHKSESASLVPIGVILFEEGRVENGFKQAYRLTLKTQTFTSSRFSADGGFAFAVQA